MLPKIWKKLFDSGVVIPTKMRACNERNGNIIFNRCSNQVNENKEFEVNLNLIKRKAAIEFCPMLPYFKE